MDGFAQSNPFEAFTAGCFGILLLFMFLALRTRWNDFLAGAMIPVFFLFLFYVALSFDVEFLAGNEPLRLAIFRPLLDAAILFFSGYLANGRLNKAQAHVRCWVRMRVEGVRKWFSTLRRSKT